MKKALITFGSVVILALVIVLFVNAREGKKEISRESTETVTECGMCPSAAGCAHEGTEAEEVVAKPEAEACDPGACPEHVTN